MREKEIVIRLKLPTTPCGRWLLGIAAAILMLGAGIAIADINTTWIASGQPLSAAQLKGDLDGLQMQVDSLQSQIASVQGSIPAALTTSGSVTGCMVVGAQFVAETPPVLRTFADGSAPDSSWITSLTRNGTGSYTIHTSLPASGSYSCVGNSAAGPTPQFTQIGGSAQALSVQIYNTSNSPVDGALFSCSA